MSTETVENNKHIRKGFDNILHSVGPFLNGLSSFLEEQTQAFELEVQDMVRYCLQSSGKRLRPTLVYLTGSEANSLPNEATVRSGAIVELVHLATLVHDDILDDAPMRHNRPSAASKFGSEAAVLLGDSLFSHALKLAAEFPTPDICRIVAEGTRNVCSGEIIQTLNAGDWNPDLERYYRIIRLKTAELFGVSCRLGALACDHGNDFANAAHTFGESIGTAYQIFDDMVDFVGDESTIGKTLGTDLATGKCTLPLLLLLQQLNETDRAQLVQSIEKNPVKASQNILESIRERSILDEVHSRFMKELTTARNVIEPFDIPSIKNLHAVADYVENQTKNYFK